MKINHDHLPPVTSLIVLSYILPQTLNNQPSLFVSLANGTWYPSGQGHCISVVFPFHHKYLTVLPVTCQALVEALLQLFQIHVELANFDGICFSKTSTDTRVPVIG